MYIKKIITGVAVATCFFMTGCANKDLPIGNYDASEVGKVKKVVPGVIISMRKVNLRGKNETQTPPAANEIDANVTRTSGFEYVVKLDSGSIISVVQNEDLRLKSRQHILIIYGDNTRIVPDESGDN